MARFAMSGALEQVLVGVSEEVATGKLGKVLVGGVSGEAAKGLLGKILVSEAGWMTGGELDD